LLFLLICVSSLIKYLRPEIEIIAPNYMPDGVSDLSYGFMKVLEKGLQVASKAL
jgi:hypothetical protein